MDGNKRFCPACGNPLPEGKDPKYCPECGMDLSDRLDEAKENGARAATIEKSQPEQVIPTRNVAKTTRTVKPKKKKTKAGRVIATIILLIAVIGGGGFGFLVLVTWDNLIGDASYVHPGAGSIESAWSIEVESTDMLQVTFTSNLSAPEISIDISYDVAGAFLKGQSLSDYYIETFDNESATKTFSLKRRNEWNFVVFDRTVVSVILREGVNYSLSVAVETGDFHMDISDNQTLGKLNVTTTTGSADITVGDNVSISGPVSMSLVTGSLDVAAGSANFAQGFDINVVTGSIYMDLVDSVLGANFSAKTTTGSLEIDLTNVTYSEDVALNFETVTGSAQLDIIQLVDPSANITCSVEVVTGSADITFQGNSTITGAYFEGSATTGSVDYTNNGGFVEGISTFYSTGYQDKNHYDFSIVTTTGGVDVVGTMLA